MAPPRVRQKFATFAACFAEQDAIAHELVVALQAKLAAVTLRNDEDSRLLKLPGEIRNRIYRYMVVQDHQIPLHVGTIRDRPSIIKFKTVPLTMVCRKLRGEVKSIYVAENKLCLTNLSSAKNFDPQHVQHLRRILGEAAKEMKQITVCRRTDIGNHYIRHSIRFTATLLPDKIEVEVQDTKLSGNALCCCWVESKAAACDTKLSETPLLDLIEAYADKAEQESGQGNRVAYGRTCRTCERSDIVLYG